MTTTTFSALNGSLVQAPRFAQPTVPAMIAKLRARLPVSPAEPGLAAQIAGTTGRLTLAAVPFAALGWLFIAR